MHRLAKAHERGLDNTNHSGLNTQDYCAWEKKVAAGTI